MQLLGATELQYGTLAVLLALAAFGSFIAGVTCANNEYRKRESMRPWEPPPPVPQYAAAERITETQPGAVVHVHLPAGLYPGFTQPTTLNAQVVPALERLDSRGGGSR